MAKRRRGTRRKKKPIIAIPFNTNLALATLANDTVLTAAVLGSNFAEDFFCVSLDGYWSLRNGTGGEGPLAVGFAHSGYSVAQVFEALQGEKTSPDDLIQAEHSRRKVRRAGIFPGLSTDEVLAQGEAVRTKIRFSVGNGFNLVFTVHNLSGSSLSTGTVVNLVGTLYGRWQR